MGLLNNLQARVRGQARRSKAKGEPEEEIPVLQNYTEEGFVVAKVLSMDSKPEASRGGKGYLHGSSLVNFCFRRHALTVRSGAGSKIPRPADRIVWAIGRAVEKHIREQFISAVKGAGVIGNWSCRCGETKVDGFRPSVKTKCPSCKRPSDRYGEIALFDHDYRIVGNPDLPYIRPDNNKVRVNEIKSMNKKDFDALTGPKMDHVWQALIYRALFKVNGFDVDDFVTVIYGCKDYSFSGKPYREFNVKVEPWHEAGLKDRWLEAEKLAKFVKDDATSPLPARLGLCVSAKSTRASGCDQCQRCFSIQ